MGHINKTLTIKWLSNKEYKFNLYTKETYFNPVKAVYIISNREYNWTHNIVYIWQTENLKERLNNHDRKNCFIRNNYNCIWVLQIKNNKFRTNIENDLLKAINTKCNIVLN